MLYIFYIDVESFKKRKEQIFASLTSHSADRLISRHKLSILVTNEEFSVISSPEFVQKMLNLHSLNITARKETTFKV